MSHRFLGYLPLRLLLLTGGITCSFVDKNFVLHDPMLALVELHGSHTGLNMAEVVIRVLEEFDIVAKLGHITVDNAANNGTMLDAIQCYMHSKGRTDWTRKTHTIPCLAHVLQLAVQVLLKSLKCQSPQYIPEGPPKRSSTPKTKAKASKTRAKATSNKSTKGNGVTSSSLSFGPILMKLRYFTKYVASPVRDPEFRSFCTRNDLRPIIPRIDGETRWGSSFEMIQQAAYLRKAIREFLSTKKEKDVAHMQMTEIEWKVVETLLVILEPFYHCTLVIQSSKRPTLQTTYYFYNYLFNKLDDMRESLAQNRSKWKQELATSVELMHAKLALYYSRTSGPTAYAESILLTPNMKKKFFLTDEWEHGFAERYTKECHERFLEKYNRPIASNHDPGTGSRPNKKGTKRKWEALEKLDNVLGESDEEMDMLDEFEKYMSEPRAKIVNALEYWRKDGVRFPRLSLMARNVHGIMATGARVERLFSTTGRIMTPERNRMSADTLIKLMYLKNGMVEDGEEFDEDWQDVPDPETEVGEVPSKWVETYLEGLRQKFCQDCDESDEDEEGLYASDVDESEDDESLIEDE